MIGWLGCNRIDGSCGHRQSDGVANDVKIGEFRESVAQGMIEIEPACSPADLACFDQDATSTREGVQEAPATRLSHEIYKQTRILDRKGTTLKRAAATTVTGDASDDAVATLEKKRTAIRRATAHRVVRLGVNRNQGD